MKVIIAGCRTFYDYNYLRNHCCKILKDINEEIEIVSGGARGTDALGEKFAKEFNFKLTVFPAAWNTYGKRAGFLRNLQMAEYSSNGGMLIAFWDGISKGTKMMIDLAKRYNLKVHIIYF